MKNELRKKYLKIREVITEKNYKDEIIYNKIINNQKVKDSKLILIYVSTNYEVDTLKLINYFLKTKIVAVPKIINNIMYFCYINSINDLEKGYFNILEPTNNNIVTDFSNSVSITPGICFSKDGDRIGYGKGFYDRFYKKNNVYSIGICYKECLVDKIKIDIYDQKIDEVISD